MRRLVVAAAATTLLACIGCAGESPPDDTAHTSTLTCEEALERHARDAYYDYQPGYGKTRFAECDGLSDAEYQDIVDSIYGENPS